MNLVFLLEEPSMKAFLEGLLPRVLPEHVQVILIPHHGKSDLEKSIPRKLRAWRAPDARFVVIRDQDSADCQDVKRRLVELCHQGGKPETLVRVACRELEAWFLGDLAAVEEAFSTAGLAARQTQQRFRHPDRLGSPSRILEELVPSFSKVLGARKLGPLLDPERCCSTSFAQLLRGLERVVGTTRSAS